MLRHLTRDQIEDEKWNQCVDQALNSMVYGQTWYLDIMADNWSGLVLGDYLAVMPLTYRKKYGIAYLYQPRFTQQFGVYSQAILTKQTIDLFIDEIPSSYKYANINLNKECLIYGGKKTLVVRNNFVVYLNTPYEILRKKYSQNTRMNVKRTERADEYGMVLNSIEDPRIIIKLFTENQLKYADRFDDADYEKLIQLVNYCKNEATIELIGVSDDKGEFCAGTILLSYKNRKTSIFSGSNQLARQQKTMFMLFDRIIYNNANQNLILDFAGSNDPGLANFYSGFASEKEEYPMLKFNNLFWPLKLLKK